MNSFEKLGMITDKQGWYFFPRKGFKEIRVF